MKLFLVGFAIIAAVSADVSHLQGGSNGYNYAQPSPTFEDQLSLPVPAQQVQQQYLPPLPLPQQQYLPPQHFDLPQQIALPAAPAPVFQPAPLPVYQPAALPQLPISKYLPPQQPQIQAASFGSSLQFDIPQPQLISQPLPQLISQPLPQLISQPAPAPAPVFQPAPLPQLPITQYLPPQQLQSIIQHSAPAPIYHAPAPIQAAASYSDEDGYNYRVPH